MTTTPTAQTNLDYYAYGLGYLHGTELADGSVVYWDDASRAWVVSDYLDVERLGRNLVETSGYTYSEWASDTETVELCGLKVQSSVDGDVGIVDTATPADSGVVVVRWLQGVTTRCALSELSVVGGEA